MVKVLFFYHKRKNEMSYKLVIAEKPSVAQSIEKVIGADKRGWLLVGQWLYCQLVPRAPSGIPYHCRGNRMRKH